MLSIPKCLDRSRAREIRWIFGAISLSHTCLTFFYHINLFARRIKINLRTFRTPVHVASNKRASLSVPPLSFLRISSWHILFFFSSRETSPCLFSSISFLIIYELELFPLYHTLSGERTRTCTACARATRDDSPISVVYSRFTHVARMGNLLLSQAFLPAWTWLAIKV